MINEHLLKVGYTIEKTAVLHKISRRQFLCTSLLIVASPIFDSTLVSLFRRVPPNFENKNNQRFMGSVDSENEYVQIEKDLLKAIEFKPHHIGNYDQLTKLYGKIKKYEKIYCLWLDARAVLERIVSNTPSRYKRYRTALRLINERIASVESIRKEKAKKIM